MDQEFMKKLLATFSSELDEKCEAMTHDLLKLEKNREVPETIEAIFRCAHNIKGAARSVGISDIGEIAHHIETLFANIQAKKVSITKATIDLCLEAIDKIRLCLDAYREKTPLPFHLPDFIDRLQCGDSVNNETTGESSSTKQKPAKQESSHPKTCHVPNEESETSAPSLGAPLDENETAAPSIRTSLEEKKTSASSLRAPPEENETAAPSLRAPFKKNETPPQSFSTEKKSIKHDPSQSKNNRAAPTHHETTAPPLLFEKKEGKREFSEHESIRVAIENLDRVSALTEEIQVTKIAIDDHYQELTKLNTKSKEIEHVWKDTGFAIQHLPHKTTSAHLQQLYHDSTDGFMEIQNTLQQLQKNMYRHLNDLTALSNSLLEEVRLLRLIPASTLFNTLPRTARDIAHELNKQIELSITGDGVKMDKMVLEGLKDPMMHLLRNAIDHGIENADIRVRQNKPATGHIHIDVQEQGDQILITVADDGAGIDISQLAATALEKQLISPAERANLSEQALLELIFRPGFSTKKIITNVSGRGVGLDVVKANIDHLKGRIEIKTEWQKGTTFYLRVPLTLASERGLLIRSGGQPWMIPTNLVERVLILQANDIIEVEASQAILLDGHPVALRILADILNLERKEIAVPNQIPIVVLKKGWRKVALLVEDILNEREMVIKPLQPPLTHVPCVTGGTLAGNGQVIIVLNANDLIDRALYTQTSAPFTALTAPAQPAAPARPHILVVDDSITTRTLEKTVLESHDYQVTVAVNGKEAWDLLQNHTFSLLITDVTMPIMDGFTLTQQVKQSATLRDLPVIIVTSLGSDAEKKRGIEAGANAYIVKNEFQSDKLLEIVSQLV